MRPQVSFPRAIAALALIAAPASAFSPVLARFRDAHIESLRAEGARVARVQGSVPPDQFFSQTLDHVDVLNNGPGTAWPQRFWVNSTFFDQNSDKAHAPVVVYIEGEGSGSPYSVLGGEHVALAEQWGALIVALEHRFYGASIPTADMSTDNLRFLSSHQAIADIASFITGYLRPTFNLTRANKLVTFGGSYPGVLSAWTRLRLPHLVHAALSTSSPVLSQVDFTGAYASVCSPGAPARPPARPPPLTVPAPNTPSASPQQATTTSARAPSRTRSSAARRPARPTSRPPSRPWTRPSRARPTRATPWRRSS